jgi:hypothetical protein
MDSSEKKNFIMRRKQGDKITIEAGGELVELFVHQTKQRDVTLIFRATEAVKIKWTKKEEKNG